MLILEYNIKKDGEKYTYNFQNVHKNEVNVLF